MQQISNNPSHKIKLKAILCC